MPSKPIKVLLITGYWQNNSESEGISNAQRNIFDTLKTLPEVDLSMLCYDANIVAVKENEIYNTRKVNFPVDDVFALSLCIERKPDLIIVTKGNTGPQERILLFIRKYMRIPIIIMWWDTSPETIARMESDLSFCDLHVILDHTPYESIVQIHQKYMHAITPQNKTMAYDDWRERDIPVSFPGKLRDYDIDRENHVYALEDAGIPVYTRGGGGAGGFNLVSPERYFGILRRSKIVLNFVYPGRYKGRLHEATLCGALVMESEYSDHTRYFTPEKEIVTYHSPADLVDKVRYYLEHDDERTIIADAGRLAAERHCDNTRIWQDIIGRVLGES